MARESDSALRFNGRTIRLFLRELLRRLDFPRVILEPDTDAGRAAYFPAPGKLPPPASDPTASSTAPAWLGEPLHELKHATKGASKLQRKRAGALAVKERTDFRVLAKNKTVSPRMSHPI